MQRNPELQAGERTLRELVEACWKDQTLLNGVQEILDQAERELQKAGAVCLGGGCCCKFDLAGHRLYVSVAELALLCQKPPPDLGRCQKKRCPYQRNFRCLARERRPLGCRTFYCRECSPTSYAAFYESAHYLIRQSHTSAANIEYRYMELIGAIATLYQFDS